MKTVKSPFKFKGGVHPDYNKELARDRPIERIPMPAELVISMSQHLGAPAKCLVKAGDFVRRGQVIGEKAGFISVCVRASADGKVKAADGAVFSDGLDGILAASGREAARGRCQGGDEPLIETDGDNEESRN